MDYLELQNNIQALRKKQGLTQDQLAEQLGVSAQAVSKWENGLSYPDIALLPKLAQLFEVSLDQLFSRPNSEIVTYVPENKRKSIDELFLRVRMNMNDDGERSRVNVNLPLALVKVLRSADSDMVGIKIQGMDNLHNIDLDTIIDLAEKGVLGKLVEFESDDGSSVSVYVE